MVNTSKYRYKSLINCKGIAKNNQKLINLKALADARFRKKKNFNKIRTK